MLSANSLALKEWAVVVRALAMGKQTLLLRKGGLHERHGRFSTEPVEFFFFPTFVHQMEQGVTPGMAADLRAVIDSQPPADQLVIDHYATVEDLLWIDSQDRLDALAPLHCWTPETTRLRFAYGKTLGLHLFVLRVYRLPQAQLLPVEKRYGGCRSWVELDRSLATAGATPVLDEATFVERQREIRTQLSLMRFVH